MKGVLSLLLSWLAAFLVVLVAAQAVSGAEAFIPAFILAAALPPLSLLVIIFGARHGRAGIALGFVGLLLLLLAAALVAAGGRSAGRDDLALLAALVGAPLAAALIQWWRHRTGGFDPRKPGQDKDAIRTTGPDRAPGDGQKRT